jgi:hypothetical protein
MFGVTTALLFLVETLLLAAPRVAVFPLAGESVSVTDLPTVDAVDGEVRRAVQKRIGAALQSKESTMTQVQVLKDVGLVCAIDDVDCQTRIAIMADVDEAVIGVVSLRPGAHALSLTLIDRETSQIVAAVFGPIAPVAPSRAADIDALVEKLLVERPKPAPRVPDVTPEPTQPEDKIVDAAPDAVPVKFAESSTATLPRPSSDEETSIASWLLIGGGVVAAGSGVAAIGALGGVVGLEVLLSSAMPWTLRVPLTYAGQVLLVVAALSTFVLVVGGATAAASLFIE